MSGTILFERQLPLSWSVLEAGGLSHEPEHNLLVFTFMDSQDELVQRKPDKEQTGELPRLEAKLNVIMQLLGMLLRERLSRPPDTLIRFSSDTLSWRTPSAPGVGTLLSVMFYPEDSLPLGLQFAAKIVSVADGWLVAEISSFSEEQQAIWSRWVFRQHRRQIAMNRTQSPSS